ncbi:MAG: DUF6934 family protein [Dyadobacter fermentans]
MHKDIYPVETVDENSLYVFVSEGAHGQVKKAVLISPLPDHPDDFFCPLFNLAFGDVVTLESGWTFDDSVRTGNGDMPKVIATVAAIAMDFLMSHPNSSLSFQGYADQKSVLLGKNQRNMLYQRGINSNWQELSRKLDIWGAAAGEFEKYIPGSSYDRILVKLK